MATYSKIESKAGKDVTQRRFGAERLQESSSHLSYSAPGHPATAQGFPPRVRKKELVVKG